MGNITFIVGGSRSGKSAYAQELAKVSAREVAFIATCAVSSDMEMKKRIMQHKKSRPKHWKTFEGTQNLPLLLEQIGDKFDVVIIDCLTLLVSGFMLNGHKESVIKNKVNQIIKTSQKIKAKTIIVSNEVGLGIVPDNYLARNFRDIAGRMNQLTANSADSVFFLVSGIPWRIK
ncbi:MAG: bifunctional adenosylcobinamide kinase/adenosylcobinamide-phosphate guanylyltransferase [Candidatus Omnitrophota bacterium]|nr:bifunctional adenosylcobinamide kinase/adenosylcobinamide-phosphate guanylyltransferase [Candidatus Omnitrophota bacterium]